MSDRIIRFPSDYTPDPNDPNNRHLSDALNPRQTEVSIMHPLELWLDREHLIAEIELSVRQLQKNFDPGKANPTVLNYYQAALQQRAEFLDYLRSNGESRVFVALYPVDETIVTPCDDADDLESTGEYGDLGDPGGGDDLPL